ncbi:putative RNA exonuclease 1-like [Penaeus vannamei]|uniref:Putative RNA exonuclease 1-like n=1 Tax=Penaeus vannamei TaxID=6689 RepID=A0A423SML7_PENVA|nr:putative RNA exonuclease 1-like [Penaeus vannamei]
MLPTSGYFRGVSCPDYEKGRCHRPFCHFHHHPRRETNTNQSQSLTSNLENAEDGRVINDVSQAKIATGTPASEDIPTCSKSETSAPKRGDNAEEASDTETSEANSGNQSELLQQLVSDAVKKALSENPLLAAAGVDPTTVMKKIDTSALIAQASAEITQTKTKKKLYLRPPDTPSYNPTPIEELNKRKRSVEASDKEVTPSKVMNTQQVQKPKVLKEISIFDAVAAAGIDCSDDSTEDGIDSTEPFVNDDSLNQKSDTPSKDKEHSNIGSSSSKADGKIKESSRNKRYSTENEASNGIFERESCNDGSDSPLPDLSALDEIPQDDWEQMINSSDRYDLQHLENLDDNDEDYDLDDLDKDDPAIMEECMRMFNEYQPEDSQPQMSSKKTKAVPKEEPESHQGKHRVARSSTGNLVAKKPEKGPRRLTPAQVMMERYQKLKEQQAELMKQLKKQKQQLDEQNRGRSSSSSAVSSTTSSKPSSFPASSSTTVKSPPMSSSGGSKRRISHVPNVSSLLHAREKIKNLPPTNSRALLSPSVAKASGTLPQTIAHTVAKGGRRTAHIPQSEALSRPVIPAEFGSKVPQNIRQRYLNSFIDECLKFTGEKTAFKIAMAEERVCYNRASSRMVYLNLAVNALKRLRTQQAAGEAAQELIDNDPQFGESSEPDEPSTSTKPSSSVSSPAPSRTASQHPINPNHVRLSHFSVLAVGGQKGSWSIEKPKKNTVDVSDCLKGLNFYKLMKKYVLTEEQLRENGYPLPDPDEKGKAIVAVV